MKHIAIIGSNGMVGSDLSRYLSTRYSIAEINRDNYQNHIGKTYDIIINANGNSKRYWANDHPLEDFMASTASVYKSIYDFPCRLYIYISSPDVYEAHDSPKKTKESVVCDPHNLEPYGFHKYLGEQIVKKYVNKFFILRCSMMLGSKLNKGPFYDIEQENPLYITRNSHIQLITTRALSEIIETLISMNKYNEVFNIGGVGTFSFKQINDIFNKKISFSDNAKEQKYEMNVTKLKHVYSQLLSSEEYLREFVV